MCKGVKILSEIVFDLPWLGGSKYHGHGLSNLFTHGMLTPYRWYMEPRPMVFRTSTNGISNPIPLYSWPPNMVFWTNCLNSHREGPGHTTARWFYMQWDVGSKYHGKRVRYTLYRGFNIPRIRSWIHNEQLVPMVYRTLLFMVLWTTHILYLENPLPMVFRTTHQRHIEPPTNGISNPYTWYFEPSNHGIPIPLSIVYRPQCLPLNNSPLLMGYQTPRLKFERIWW
jgi:hypothetical protein